MIISLSGAPGSGKSTIAQMLAKELGWPRHYMGGIRREAAKRRGLTLAEYNRLGENDLSTDKEVDDLQCELGKKQDNFVIEGRTSWYFIPHSFKIYLDVKPEEGAKRIFSSLSNDNSRNEDLNLSNWEDVLKSTKERMDSDRLRYRQYYKFDATDPKNFDFYLDTTEMSPEQVFSAIYTEVRNKLDNKKN